MLHTQASQLLTIIVPGVDMHLTVSVAEDGLQAAVVSLVHGQVDSRAAIPVHEVWGRPCP